MEASQGSLVATKRAVVKLDAKKAKKDRALAADRSQCSKAGRTRHYSRGGEVCTYGTGTEAGRRTGCCPDPLRTCKRDGRDKADHCRNQTGAVSRHLYRMEGGFEEEEVELAMKSGASSDTWQENPSDRDRRAYDAFSF